MLTTILIILGVYVGLGIVSFVYAFARDMRTLKRTFFNAVMAALFLVTWPVGYSIATILDWLRVPLPPRER